MGDMTIGDIIEKGNRLMEVSGIREYCRFCGGKCCDHPDYFPDRCCNFPTCRKKPCVLYICKPLQDTIGKTIPTGYRSVIALVLLSDLLLEVFSQMMPDHIAQQHSKIDRNILAIRETYDFSAIHKLLLDTSLKMIINSSINHKSFASCMDLFDKCLMNAAGIRNVCKNLIAMKIDVVDRANNFNYQDREGCPE